MSKTEIILILCLNAELFNKKINFPQIGEVEIGESGEVSVPIEVAQLLVDGTEHCSWKYSEEPSAGDV